MFLFTTIDRTDTVQSALSYASANTGVDFDYLLATARRESSLDPQAKARTSTASGLFQFIESTWLATLKEAGPRHGYGELAEKIRRTPGGGYAVSDPGARQEILALRHDPKAAALMAGEFTRKNGESLERAIGRAPSAGELYIAHFLGAQGATELLRLVETAPQAPAAEHFASAARANRSIFYTGDGRPRSAHEVYANLVRSHGAGGAARSNMETAMAYAPSQDRVDQVFHSMFSDPAGTVGAGRGAGLGPIARSAGSFWSGLFTSPGQPEAGGPGTADSPDGAEPRRAATTGGGTQAAVEPAAAGQRSWRWEDPSLPLRKDLSLRGLW